jgi:hypothetical protein
LQRRIVGREETDAGYWSTEGQSTQCIGVHGVEWQHADHQTDQRMADLGVENRCILHQGPGDHCAERQHTVCPKTPHGDIEDRGMLYQGPGDHCIGRQHTVRPNTPHHSTDDQGSRNSGPRNIGLVFGTQLALGSRHIRLVLRTDTGDVLHVHSQARQALLAHVPEAELGIFQEKKAIPGHELSSQSRSARKTEITYRGVSRP